MFIHAVAGSRQKEEKISEGERRQNAVVLSMQGALCLPFKLVFLTPSTLTICHTRLTTHINPSFIHPSQPIFPSDNPILIQPFTHPSRQTFLPHTPLHREHTHTCPLALHINSTPATPQSIQSIAQHSQYIFLLKQYAPQPSPHILPCSRRSHKRIVPSTHCTFTYRGTPPPSLFIIYFRLR